MARKPKVCARCGLPIQTDLRVYSTYTKQWYCGSIKECDRRCRNDLTLEEIAEITTRTLKALS